jgi:hypothetical protein
MRQLETLLQDSIQDNHDQQTNVSFKFQQMEKTNEYLQEEMETIMTTLPHLSTTLQSQNQQLQRTIDDNTDFCRVTSETITNIQHQQSNTDNRLDQIQVIINQLIQTTTPSSSRRNRKKSISTNQLQTTLFSNASDGDYDEHLPTSQLEMILNNNTSAISHALNTTNESINMSFTSNNQDNPDNTEQLTNNDQDHIVRDLGNPYPANDT